MMNVLIVEDENPAAEMLSKMLHEIAPDVRIAGVASSIADAVAWLSRDRVDLIFMDIELGDGLSIEIFDRIAINCPVIFITAYDEYWQEAFEHNGIDYLLKPLKKERLESALGKLKHLKEFFHDRFRDLTSWRNGSKPKERFLVKRGSKFISLKTENIAYFFSSQKMTFLVDDSGIRYPLDESLVQIESALDPNFFFRINRKYVVRIDAVAKIQALPKSKLSIELKPPVNEELVISSENSGDFKKWMDR
jgi:two-component system LytT family response regulator